MAPMPHSQTYTADTGAEDGERQTQHGWPRRTRPCFSLPKAHASVDGHESGSNGTSRVATAKESGRKFWQWSCWGRYGLTADLRRWGKLPARRGTWLTVLFMLHGRRTYELIFLHGYVIFRSSQCRLFDLFVCWDCRLCNVPRAFPGNRNFADISHGRVHS